MIELSALLITILAISILAFLFGGKKMPSEAPVSPAAASCEEADPVALPDPVIAPAAVQVAERPHALLSEYTPSRAVDLTAVLRDLDFVFPQIPVKPSTTMEEVQFNAGQRSLADWMRQQYITRGKQAGSMAKPLSI